MSFVLSDKVEQYLAGSHDELVKLIEELCQIPAPSHHEEKRAEFCKNWLETNGAEGVYIDDALNVIYPIGCEGNTDIVLFLAHTDTVFPDIKPMHPSKDDEYIYCPGVGDNTARVALMMIIARYVAREKLIPNRGIMFVANSCEEGLGNLKGIRRIMSDFKDRIKEVYSFDANYMNLYNKCVGSHRYEITFETEGGHSYSAFGNRNAIYAASDFVCKLYSCEVPENGDSKTTYNVGRIEGGESINSIAQKATVLYEYRSDDIKCLGQMQEIFERIIEEAKRTDKSKINVKSIGIRPCGVGVDESQLDKMTKMVKDICEKYTGVECVVGSASTDCNIPMSLGVPAICVGNCVCMHAHSREEKLLISSLIPGLRITADIILRCFKEN